ncbi:MAG: DUF3500 domain-containing protein [Pseudomonadota bacterium]
MDRPRRKFLATGVAAGIAAALPRSVVAQSGDVGPAMRERALAFLAGLDQPKRDRATFGFATQQRRGWNFMLGSSPAPGLALENMSASEKDLALDLLATGTNAFGLEKALNIMLQQDILRDEWSKGSPDRNRERFSVQIYGTPSATGPWAWRWEGHHLSLTFTLLDDEVISTTPSAFSSEPNTVPSGPHRGLVVLQEEETLGRALFSDLDGATRRAALVWDNSPGNIQSVRGREVDVARQLAGVPLGDLSQGQADMARRLIEVYTSEVLPRPLARIQDARIRGEDFDGMRFAWGGGSMEGSIYYRITGANMLIEFATLRNQPQHLHAVFHDTARNFGAHQV